MKFKTNRQIKFSSIIGLTTSILVTMATLGIAIYALFFINDMFSYLLPQDQLYSRLLIFKDTLNRLIFAFITLGLIGSYYMTKMIINPIQKMIDGSKELTKGNLANRLEVSKYEEINNLIETYNTMAESLESLYSNLENTVKGRTQELEKANLELKNTQTMMVHSEKMRSLGQLVSGITHEINNPINFIHGNMMHLKNYSSDLVKLIELYESAETDLSEEKQQEIKTLKENIELDFIKEDLPMLIKSCYEGTERTKNIIIDLKNFSRIDEMVINSINLEKEIDTTLNILNNKIKGKIEVLKEYEDNIPLIEGFGGQLNQVFMNILDNACYAIKEKGEIRIRLKKTEKDVIIEFEDSGSGMNKEQTDKIFEPFYTTKPVGEGSGMGMSISYKVIQNHQGTITIKSEIGTGTTFRIQLPIKMEVALNKEVGTKV